MPIVENHAEHAFHLPPQSSPTVGKDKDGKDIKDGPLMATPVAFQDGLMFPRAGKVDEEGNPEPSRTKVSADQLARLKAHHVAKSWFKPFQGKLQLVVSSDSDVGESMPLPDENALGAPKQKARQQA